MPYDASVHGNTVLHIPAAVVFGILRRCGFEQLHGCGEQRFGIGTYPPAQSGQRRIVRRLERVAPEFHDTEPSGTDGRIGQHEVFDEQGEDGFHATVEEGIVFPRSERIAEGPAEYGPQIPPLCGEQEAFGHESRSHRIRTSESRPDSLFGRHQQFHIAKPF